MEIDGSDLILLSGIIGLCAVLIVGMIVGGDRAVNAIFDDEDRATMVDKPLASQTSLFIENIDSNRGTVRNIVGVKIDHDNALQPVAMVLVQPDNTAVNQLLLVSVPATALNFAYDAAAGKLSTAEITVPKDISACADNSCLATALTFHLHSLDELH